TAAAQPVRLDRGWEFVITPAGQQPISFTVQPAFLSAVNFLSRIEANVNNEREVSITLERPPSARGAAGNLLLPAQIAAALQLPPQAQKLISASLLEGQLEFGGRLDLGFVMP